MNGSRGRSKSLYFASQLPKWPVRGVAKITFLGSFARSDGGAASWCREPEEGQLLASARSGQAAAFAEFGQPHAKKILRATYRISKNREVAEDAVRDSFLKAVLHIEHFAGRSSVSTWLTSITSNFAFKAFRGRWLV